MPNIGLFQAESDPNYSVWINDRNIKYIQSEVARRLAQTHCGRNEVAYDYARRMLIDTYTTWRNPQTLNELLEMVICNFVTDITTEIERQNNPFDSYNPRTLYFPGTGITREERVKLNPGYKFEFQMNY